MAMDTTLASNADAQLILKLYELRTEQVMRAARAWVVGEFWPATAEEFFALVQDRASEHNAYVRQVASYWEMAAAFVLHGALDADLFIDCVGENLLLLAKFSPLLEEIRKKSPHFMKNTEELTRRFPAVRQRYEVVLKMVESMRPVGARP